MMNEDEDEALLMDDIAIILTKYTTTEEYETAHGSAT